MATTVSSWGWGGNGQLGLGDRDSRIKPHEVRALGAQEPITQVVCGSRFTLALTSTGSVFSWGKNDYGQLGTGDTKAHIEPYHIDALAGVAIVALASRGSHVLALSDTGRVFSWGRGDEGQLGHGDRESLSLPRQISELRMRRIRLVAAGRSHSVAVDESGAIYTWGSNEDGALGRDIDGDSTSPVPGVIDSFEERRIYAWGWGIYGQLGLGDTVSRSKPTELLVFRGKKVVKICCGFRHSFAILPRRLTRRVTSSSLAEMLTPESGLSNVDVWGWGWNEHGQLGEATPNGIVAAPMKIQALSNVDLHLLAAGGRHTICHLGVEEPSNDVLGRARSETDPRVHFRGTYRTLAHGRGSDGELGVGAIQASSLPVSIPAFQGKKLLAISCGWAHTVSLGTDPLLITPTDGNSSSTWFSLAVSAGDIDAFCGLLVQFVIQILLIFQLLPVQCGFTTVDVTTRIIPAAAATVAVGNVFFGMLATVLQKREGRLDVTALPEGINTVLVFAYALSVMAPEFTRTRSAEKAWEAGVFAAFMTGLMQVMCIPLVRLMKRCIPRAALLSSVAGVALAFLTMGFAFEVWQNPLVSLGPLFLVLICLGAGVKLPFRLPTGMGALLLGTGTAFALYYWKFPIQFTPYSQPFEFGLVILNPDVSILARAITSGDGWKYFSVIIPMVLVNVMSTLANLETAIAVGDSYDPSISILGDSITTMIGACLGNPFPTSVYIGQPIYKSMGARSSYVYLTAGAVMIIALFNATTLIVNTVPLSSGVGFLFWIGLVISASSFSHTPLSNSNHGTAVALGMVPALGSWAFQLVQTSIVATHSAGSLVRDSSPLQLQSVLDELTVAGANPSGMIALSQGYLLTSILLASTMVNIIEREFLLASAWMGVAGILSALGAIHSFEVDGDVVHGTFGFVPGGLYGWAARFAAAYCGVSLLLVLFHLREGEISVRPMRHAWSSVKNQITKMKKRLKCTNDHSARENKPILGC